MIHFLHIGKTGGTALRHALSDVKNTPYGEIKLHNHETRLCDIPEGDKVIFFLRDPQKRFASGFYSRQRKGQPRYYSEWSADEALAFSEFTAPSEIIGYATSGNIDLYRKAIHALISIEHIKNRYSNWLGSINDLNQREKDILYVGSLETLNLDFEQIKKLLGLSDDIQLPTSDNEAHKNPNYEPMQLDPAQTAFFRGWYYFDYQIYQRLVNNNSVNLKNE